MKVKVKQKDNTEYTEITTTVISQPVLEQVMDIFLSKDVEKINELKKVLNEFK